MSAFFTQEQLKRASAALSEARRTFDCKKPRTDAAGNTSQTRQLQTRGVGLEERTVEFGTHGAAYLEVDVATATVRCGACAGSVKAIVVPKESRIAKSGRIHWFTRDEHTARTQRP